MLLLCLGCKPDAEPRRSSADPPSTQAPVSIDAPTFARIIGSPDLSRIPCFSRDSLAHSHHIVAFAHAVTDTEYTQDVSGEVLYLVLRDSAPAVYWREAAGEWLAADLVDSAVIDFRDRTLWVRVDSQYRIRGTFDCDTLRGEASIGSTTAPRRMHRADPYLPEAEAPN